MTQMKVRLEAFLQEHQLSKAHSPRRRDVVIDIRNEAQIFDVTYCAYTSPCVTKSKLKRFSGSKAIIEYVSQSLSCPLFSSAG